MNGRERITFAAASMRFVLALFALVALPLALPGTGAHLWVFGIYVTLAGVFQWMLWKKIGGVARSLGSGIVDLAIVTFIVHRVGSASTMMVSLYFFAATMNALVVGRREGIILGVVGALAYDALVLSEAGGLVPYAPDGPSWISGQPTLAEALVFAAILTSMLISTSAVVGSLVHQIEQRQTELIAANAKLAELSLRDPLTQLYNRRYLMERLDMELARVRRGRPLSVVMVDLDRFKRVNDETGHQRGDILLQELARGLSSSVREADVVGRYGGDEFVIVLPDTDGEAGETVAARVRDGIREVGTRFDPERPVTASVGLAIARSDDDARGLLQRADRASYVAKAEGGDRISLESMEGDAPVSARNPLEQHP